MRKIYIYKPDNWVWIYIIKKRFSQQIRFKLMLKREGSFQFEKQSST